MILSSNIHIFVTFLVALCSIVYELVIAQTLSLLAANTVIWYSITVGLFLLGMGFGAFVGGHLSRRFDSLKTLIAVEILLSLLGALAVSGVHFLHMFYSYQYVWNQFLIGLAVFYGGTFILIVTIGTLTGIELPLLVELGKLGNRENNSLKSFSTTLGVDYFGSLVGALIFPLFLLPNFETFTIGLITASLNAGLALLLIIQARSGGTLRMMQTAACLGLFVFLGSGFINRKDVQQYFLRKYYYYIEASDSLEQLFARMQDYPKVIRRSSPYQKIDLFKDVTGSGGDRLLEAYSDKYEEHPDFPKNLYLFLNGDLQFNSSYEEVYHEFFAHVPLILKDRVPDEVLVLGGGDGFLVRELLKYPQIKHIRHIDLDRELVEFAKTNPRMLKMNKGAFLDPKVTTDYADAFQYVRNPDRRYEAVYIDFPAPVDYNLAKLYSREFFQFLRERVLTENGFVVFDATGTGDLTYPDQSYNQEPTEFNDWPFYYNTVRAAGYKVVKPYVTTLEFRSARAKEILKTDDQPIGVTPDMMSVLQAANNSQEAQVVMKAVERAAISGMLAQHVMSLQQGFMIMANRPEAVSGEYKDYDIDLHVLNKQRFDLSFKPSFPQPAEIDWSKVNSIMRPTFPTQPVWQPRVPF